jgi:hypothetical protein
MPEYKNLIPVCLKMRVSESLDDCEFLTHQQIENLMDLSVNSNRYRSQIKLAMKELLKSSRGLLSKRSVGYYIIGPDLLVNVASKRIDTSNSRCKESIEILESIDRKVLSSESKMKFDLCLMRITKKFAGLTGSIEVSLMRNENKKNRGGMYNENIQANG